APQPDLSPTRSAGRPPISTVALPGGKGDGGCGPAGVGIEQVCVSPATAAGCPPISTVATPGPVTTPGWAVGSPTRAAGGMAFSPGSRSRVDLHQRSGDGRIAGRGDVGCGRAADADGRRADVDRRRAHDVDIC